MLPKVELYGVQVTRATEDELVAEARSLVRTKSPGNLYVAVNVHTYQEAQRNPGYRTVLNSACVAWPDGVPIRWASRLAGRETGPRIHGHDLMLRFLREPFSHFFYGSTPDVLEDMKKRLPKVKIAGAVSPPFSKSAVESDVSTINASGADILWVALGAPKQEMWAAINRSRITVPIIACVGAAFDIIAGRFRRAPLPLQRAGLEWAWRLAQDPNRLWRRYFSTNGSFIAHVVSGWLAGR